MADLPPLPPSSDKYFENADVNQHRMEEVPQCKHYFERLTANEVQCKNCPAGFFIKKETVKDGHLYLDGKLVI